RGACLISLLLPPPPRFPYTTLFRSVEFVPCHLQPEDVNADILEQRPEGIRRHALRQVRDDGDEEHRHYASAKGRHAGPPRRAFRSEEHTSELQSRENLVCRLLLEKK